VEESERGWERIRNIWQIIDQLRGIAGCPWDRRQTPESVQTYLVEEAHEAAAAVRAKQVKEVAEELGDLLFMVLFLVYLYEEKGDFRLTNFRLNWFRAVQTASRHIDSNRLFLQQGNCLGQGTGGYCGHRTILWPGGGRGRLVVHKKSAKNSAGVEKGLEEF